MKAEAGLDRPEVPELREPAERSRNRGRLSPNKERGTTHIEHLTSDRGALQEVAVRGRQVVETRADRGLDGDGNAVARRRVGPRELDHEEWVPCRAKRRTFIGGSGTESERGGIPLVERADVDVQPITTRSYSGLRELRTGGREHKDRNPRTRRDAFEKTNELRVGPVKVVDPDHDRAVFSEGAEISPPAGRECLEPLGGTQAQEPAPCASAAAVSAVWAASVINSATRAAIVFAVGCPRSLARI